MSAIVLMVPRKPPGLAGNIGELAYNALPWVPGECQIAGFEFMLTCESVEWSSNVEVEVNTLQQRTVHLPTISTVKIVRRIDGGTAILTKNALSVTVTSLPWHIFFLKSMGDSPVQLLSALDSSLPAFTMATFMVMKLHQPLVTKFEFTMGEGDGQETMEVSATSIEWTYFLTDSTSMPTGLVSLEYNIQKGSFV